MKDTLGVALIGCGRAGMIHARNFASRIPGMRLAAVSDADPAAAQLAAKECDVPFYTTDWRKVLQKTEVQAVVIATPTKYHREIAVASAEAGKHILCEKPMAMDVEECRQMNEAALQAGITLQIGFMRRFDKNFLRAKELIEAGEIGDVVMVKSLTRGPSTPKPWMYDIQKSNGPLAEVNSHDIDTLRWFTGSEVRSLWAVGENFRCPDAREEFPDFYDTVLMSLRMENGMIGCIDGAQGVKYGYDARVDILGTHGCLQIGELQENTTLCYTGGGSFCGDVVKSWRGLFEDAYLAEDTAFAACVRDKTPPLVTGTDGMRAVEIVCAGNRSIKEKEIISL